MPSGLQNRLLNIEERYAPEAYLAMMNLFNSHDTNRLLFLLDHNANQNNVSLYLNPAYDWSDSLARQRGAALAQMTLPGAPTIYYGDEVGLVNPPSFDGNVWQDDPYNRAPYPWLDETGTPFYAHLQTAAPGSARAQTLDWYQTLTATRHANPALRTGTLDFLLTDDANNIVVYGRKLEDDSNAAVVVLNRNASAQTVTVDVSGYLPTGASLTDALTGATYSVNASGQITGINAGGRNGALLVTTGFVGRPGAVADLSATAGSGEVTLTWSPAVNATEYDIYRSQLSGGGYIYLDTVSGAFSYTDSDASNATRYHYVLVSRNGANLLESEFSNEAEATPALAIGWANLQWPFEITHVLSAVNPTDTIFGQIWIDGFTGPGGPAAGVTAQVGYGSAGTPPDTWTWFPMTYNEDVGNNDEYMGTLLPASVGTFRYTTRWSTDGGQTWIYADRDGINYNEDRTGELTVIEPTDTDPPEAPTGLNVTGTTSGSISLGWDAHPNTGGDLFGFRIYRELDGVSGFAHIGSVSGAGATSYTDSTVVSGQTYNYYITAIDTSLNESDGSNIVQATAQMLMVDVTFRVTVPEFTLGTVYLAGGFGDAGYPNWNPGGMAMTQIDATTWEITLQLLDGTIWPHKYARGDWSRVEKGADGHTELADRMVTVSYGTDGTQLVTATVANWQDPIVTGVTPENEAIDVDPTTTVAITFSQAMNPAPSNFTVTGPGGVVVGSTSYDADTFAYIFTPDADLPDGTYTVTASGNQGAVEGAQFHAFSSTFTVGDDVTPTPDGVAVTFTVTVPDFTPDGSTVYIVGSFGDCGEDESYPDWNPSGLAMTQSDTTTWTITLDLTPGATCEYKYTRGDWDYVEKEANGYDDVPNRVVNVSLTDTTQDVSDTVPNWRDPLVVSVDPADGATDVDPSATVVITWNKNMPISDEFFNPGSGYAIGDHLTVSGAGGAVAGTYAYGGAETVVVFTPDADLPDGEYDVVVSGASSWDGVTQIADFASTFTVGDDVTPTPDGVAVTFIVTVPDFTPDGSTVYIVGSFGDCGEDESYPNWNPSGLAMTQSDTTTWAVTLDLTPGATCEYKYTRGDWDYVEKEANGYDDVPNRVVNVSLTDTTQDVSDSVINWRDPLVVSVDPADGATDVDPSATVVITWNKNMPLNDEFFNPGSGYAIGDHFTVSGAGGVVAGTYAYGGAETVVVFTPDADLPDGEYDVVVSGASSWDGVTQIADFASTFTVGDDGDPTDPGDCPSGAVLEGLPAQASAGDFIAAQVVVDPAFVPLVDRVEFELFDSEGRSLDTWTELIAPYYYRGDIDGVPHNWRPAALGDFTLRATVFVDDVPCDVIEAGITIVPPETVVPAPPLVCEAGTAPVALIAAMTTLRATEPTSVSTTVDLTSGAIDGSYVLVQSAVGHPGLGCPDADHPWCGQEEQTLESLDVVVNGEPLGNVPDHGTDRYEQFTFPLALAAGTHTFEFVHAHIGAAGIQSLDFNAVLCVVSASADPEATPEPEAPTEPEEPIETEEPVETMLPTFTPSPTFTPTPDSLSSVSLGLGMTVDRDFVIVGDRMTISVVITNPTGQTINDVQVDTILPPELIVRGMRSTHGSPFLAFDTTTPDSGRAFAKAPTGAAAIAQRVDQIVRLGIGSLAAGEVATLTIDLEIPASYTDGDFMMTVVLRVNNAEVDRFNRTINVVSALPATGERPLWAEVLRRFLALYGR